MATMYITVWIKCLQTFVYNGFYGDDQILFVPFFTHW